MIRSFVAALAAALALAFCAVDARAQINTTANGNGTAASGVGTGGTGIGTGATGIGGSSTATGGSSTSITGPSSATSGPASASTTINATTPAQTSQVVWQAPAVYAPPVVGGNLCAVGASSGVSWLGAGLALGASWESDNCERRQLAAMLYNAGSTTAAKELLCDQRAVYDAMRRAGTPCVARAKWDGDAPAVSQPPPPQPLQPPRQVAAFDASCYATASECLNMAFASGAPLVLCRGKP
jgi:hypothetical protein